MDFEPVAAEPRWGLGDAAAGFGAAYLLAILASLVYVAVTGDAEVTWGLTVVSTFALWIGLAGVPLLAVRVKGSGSVADDLGLRVRFPADLKLGVGWALLAQVALLAVAALSERLSPGLELEQEGGNLAQSVTGIRLVILLLIFVVGAPLVEEIFFRGLLLRALERRFGSGVAVAVSGAIFGLVHLEGDTLAARLLLAFSLSVLGWLLGWMTVRYKRLGPALLCHVFFNTIAAISLVTTA